MGLFEIHILDVNHYAALESMPWTFPQACSSIPEIKPRNGESPTSAFLPAPFSPAAPAEGLILMEVGYEGLDWQVDRYSCARTGPDACRDGAEQDGGGERGKGDGEGDERRPIHLTIFVSKSHFVRSIQKTQTKPQGAKPERRKAIGARFVLLRPAGYPLKSMFQECPSVADARLFELYAREQWYGEEVKPGCYLFDRRLYPDYAFQVVKVHPRHSVVGLQTTIRVEQKAEEKKGVRYDVSFDDVVGQEKAKRKVKIVEKYLQDPERFGRWAPHNILFYGVSGTGKTMIAKALSAKTGVPMLAVKSTSLIGEFVGEGARQIHSLYEKAEEMAPCIIFIDELDAIALDRRYQDLRGDVSEMVNSLLTEMDGISSRLGICTIAATNQIEVLDASVRSRFEEEIEFKLPDKNERLQILEKNARTLPLEMENVDLKEIARQTEGFSGRDLVEKVLKVALHHALMDECNITQEHVIETISRARKEYRQAPSEMFC